MTVLKIPRLLEVTRYPDGGFVLEFLKPGRLAPYQERVGVPVGTPEHDALQALFTSLEGPHL